MYEKFEKVVKIIYIVMDENYIVYNGSFRNCMKKIYKIFCLVVYIDIFIYVFFVLSFFYCILFIGIDKLLKL